MLNIVEIFATLALNKGSEVPGLGVRGQFRWHPVKESVLDLRISLDLVQILMS